MRRVIITFFSFLLILSPVVLQAAEVKNVVARPVGNRVLFEYDLTGDEREAEVSVTITIKGQTYPTDKLHLEGDVGKVRTGSGKRIWWNVLQDFPRGYAGELQWEIVAGGGKFTDPVTGMEFAFVKGGCFEMGDTFGDGGLDEKPVHEVCVDDFYLGKYEVTQGQWEKVMGNNPSRFKGRDNPVEQVSWKDVQEYIDRLNRQSGRKYRLPTEAEWEYAARSGGKRDKFSGTSQESELGQYAWYSSNSGKQTQPVGQKKPNGLGLHDMSGNVWEWCADWYDENYYKKSLKNNPRGPSSGSMRVLRGGSWSNNPRYVRAASRVRYVPPGPSGPGMPLPTQSYFYYYGFRLGLSAR